MKRLVLFLCLPVSIASAQGLPPVPVPPGNPITPAKADLGKVLFWDEALSSTRTVACGTCHIPSAGGSDPRSFGSPLGSRNPGADGLFGTPDDVTGSPGIVRCESTGKLISDATFALTPQVTGRKTPSMINAAFAPSLFWDGRAEGSFFDPVSGNLVTPVASALESQAAGPPLSDVEMGHEARDWLDVAARIESAKPLGLAASVPPALEAWMDDRSYPELFGEAFGTEEVTPTRILQAIGTYQRTLISDETPFDAGGPGGPGGGGPGGGGPGGLNPQEAMGLQVFNGPGNCNACHTGPLLTDNQFHNIGVRPPIEDLGRGGVTGLPQDNGRFRTPGLRNSLLRAPYFHNGSAATLEEVVEFYDRGGDFAINLDPQIQPLGLDPEQKAALVAFLSTGLLDQRVADELAPFDRPTLYSESNRVPEAFGFASPGSGGALPRQVALEPPVLGNPSFTLGLDDVAAGVPAVLGFDLSSVRGGLAVEGITLYLSLSPSFFVATTQLTDAADSGAGYTSYSLPVPDVPSFAGLDLYSQWVVLDPGARNGISASPGVRTTIF